MLNHGGQYIDEENTGIKDKIKYSYRSSESIWQQFWNEALIDSRLEAGDGYLNEEIAPRYGFGNNNYVFNRVRPLCSMVSGHQRKNRKSIMVVPMEDGDQQTADQWTKILLNIFKRENIYDTISDAFHQGACITGINLLHLYIDYQNDPVSGDLKVDNLQFNQFFIDPYFKNPDLSDAAFIWRRSYMSHSAAAMMLPQHYDEIMSLTSNNGVTPDARFQYMPEAYGISYRNQVAYDEYYYRAYRKQELLIDQESGLTYDVTNSKNIDIDRYLKDFQQVKKIERYIPTVRLAILVQDKLFYDGPQPINCDFYPFVPVMGYFNPMMPYFYNRMQGLCRSMRDPQMLLNRRIILSADAAESVVNSGWIFKQDAVLDVKHLFQTGQGRIIPLKKDAQMSDIQQITPPSIPQYFFELQETFSKELNMVTGITEELQGMNIDDTSGILSALRQSAGLVTLQPLFDRLDNSQMQLGDKMMEIIRKNYTPGKIMLLLEGEEPAPLFYNRAFGKYHSQVQLGFNTESQKQMQLAQLVELRKIGVPIPEESLLEAATIQNKDKIMQTIAQNQQQAQQAQQAQQQSEMQLNQAQMNLANARATADKGLGIERVSRVAENQALATERKAEAQKDRLSGLLDLVKALKELENIDIQQLRDLLLLQDQIKNMENRQETNE